VVLTSLTTPKAVPSILPVTVLQPVVSIKIKMLNNSLNINLD
tara:strand:+ start:308 stop:433 length:126 start_codon:yes stop_codon:yes gene_type:complete